VNIDSFSIILFVYKEKLILLLSLLLKGRMMSQIEIKSSLRHSIHGSIHTNNNILNDE